MTVRPKSSYHPYLLVAFYLNCLPDDILQHVPRSTRHDWRHKDQPSLFGYEWYIQNRHTFDTLQQVAAHKRLLKINRALLRVLALRSFIRTHAHRIKDNVLDINDGVLNNLYKISRILGVRTTLKYLQLPYSWYLNLKRKTRCRISLFSSCRIKHPLQLVTKEINSIIAYCGDLRYLHWPLASLYHLMRREGVASFTISTFYKYITLLHVKRSHPAKRKKNHHTGIRAD